MATLETDGVPDGTQEGQEGVSTPSPSFSLGADCGAMQVCHS